MDNEKRGAVRVKKNISVQYQFTRDDKTIWDMSFVKDISEKGVCITTNTFFEPNSWIVLSFKLPNDLGNPITIRGKVVDEKKLGQTTTFITRVEFIDLTAEQKESIKQFVAWAISLEKPKK